MGVDGGIAGSSRQILPFPVGNVLSVPLNVALCQPKVDEEHFVSSFVEADAKVVGFDVSVEEVAVVNVLDPGDHLVDQHQHSFQGELPQGVFEEVLQGRAHEIHDQNVVVP